MTCEIPQSQAQGHELYLCNTPPMGPTMPRIEPTIMSTENKYVHLKAELLLQSYTRFVPHNPNLILTYIATNFLPTYHI